MGEVFQLHEAEASVNENFARRAFAFCMATGGLYLLLSLFLPITTEGAWSLISRAWMASAYLSVAWATKP